MRQTDTNKERRQRKGLLCSMQTLQSSTAEYRDGKHSDVRKLFQGQQLKTNPGRYEPCLFGITSCWIGASTVRESEKNNGSLFKKNKQRPSQDGITPATSQHLLTCSGSDPCVLSRHYYIITLVGTHVSDNTHL